MASAAVDVLPAEPPTWERAGALATHARALLTHSDTEPARIRAEEADAAASAAGAPWLQADALSTLSAVSERLGRIDEAKATLGKAVEVASGSDRTGVELRARTLLAMVQLESGDLKEAGLTAHLGTRRAELAGLSLAPYGLDLQYLHYLAHYSDGNWDQAQEIANRFPVRVGNVAEARLSAMALFIDVARASERVAERRTWLEPYMAEDELAAYIAGGLFAEDAFWAGQLDDAVAAVLATISAAMAFSDDYGPQLIRPAAVGLSALADQARHARAAGQDAAAIVAQAGSLIDIARKGDNRAALGVDGRGWLARAEAEWWRASGDNQADNWLAVLAAFGADFPYEAARTRWRLAEALAEAGERDAAQQEWLLATDAAEALGANRLRDALTDLGRRARLGRGAVRPGPLGVLTEREQQVLRQLAAGRSNREIAAELFISDKTVSVHVSNILGKLGASSRTEAAAIAHGSGLNPAARS
jgi:DNA-binding CsgD family transcriptional regulator